MNGALTIACDVQFTRGNRGRRRLQQGRQEPPQPCARIPRVSRLMALAIRFDGLIRDGAVTDQAELARVGHVTRARLTQIMNLLYLAPHIQEAILCLPATEKGREPVKESKLRPIAAELDWREQRRMWEHIIQNDSRLHAASP
jgi:hypothetical protein